MCQCLCVDLYSLVRVFMYIRLHVNVYKNTLHKCLCYKIKEKSIVKYLLIPDDAFSVCYSSDYFSVALKSSLPFLS